MPDNQDTFGMRRVTDLPIVVAATSAPSEFQHLINQVQALTQAILVT
jgi:PII-like signaling protein